jgi:hypothetical protein
VRAVSSVTALSHILVLVPARTVLRAISDGSNLRFSDRQSHIAKSPHWRVRLERARDLRTEHVLYSIVHTILDCHFLSHPFSPYLHYHSSRALAGCGRWDGTNESQVVLIPYKARSCSC